MKTISKKERCLALLALHLQQETASSVKAGSVPSDEELEALGENNKKLLNPLRRQQLLQHIAHDEKVYARWLAIIECRQSSEIPLAKNMPTMKLKNSFYNKKIKGIFSSFKNRLRLIPIGGTATAMLAVLVAFIFLPGSPNLYQIKVDTVYDTYGDFLINSPQPILPSRSAGEATSEHTISPAKLLIKKGVQQGFINLHKELEKINNQQSIPEWQSNSYVQNISQKDQDMLVSLGRLTILTHYQCLQKNQNYEFMQTALPIYKELIDELVYLHYAELEPLKRFESQDIKDEKRVCIYSKFVMSELNLYSSY